MNPERLAELEQLVAGEVHLKPSTGRALIAHIRYLEAQLAAAREALTRIAFEDEVVYFGCADMPFCQGTHDERCPVRIARDALATATPPSPEVTP